MFKFSKKQSNKKEHPFTGYVANSTPATTNQQVAVASHEAVVSNEPAPGHAQPSAVDVQSVQKQPAPEPTPAAQSGSVVEPVKPAPPVSEEVKIVESALSEQAVEAQPEPIEEPKQIEISDLPVQTVPISSTYEERAEMVANNRELAELLGWVERDTADRINEVQSVIDDLNSKIDHLRTSYAQDTARLSEDAKIVFKENIEKNIALLKEQINNEIARRDVLNKQKEAFIEKIHEAVKNYHESKANN